MDSIAPVSPERAKQLGIAVRSQAAGPAAVWVEVAFENKGELKGFDHVRLAVTEGKRLLVVSYLENHGGMEKHAEPGRIAVRFTADRSRLDQFTLTALKPIGLGNLGYQLRLSDFVDLRSLR